MEAMLIQDTGLGGGGSGGGVSSIMESGTQPEPRKQIYKVFKWHFDRYAATYRFLQI